MMVAQIAYDRLTPTAKTAVDQLLAVPINPQGVTKKTVDFVGASHWADDVRPLNGFEFSNDLHFVDYPFSADGTDLPEDLPLPDNVVKAVTDYVDVLKSDTASDNDKAEALRFVIHFVGDMHQPLHCGTRVSAAFPEGDRGGNKFVIATRDDNGKRLRTKLHSYWDGGMGSFPRMGAHFAPPPMEEIAPAAAVATDAYPDSNADWQGDGPFDFLGWAKESENIAENFTYKGLVQKKEPTAKYKNAALKVAQKRVAWAGYRLAALLNAIYL